MGSRFGNLFGFGVLDILNSELDNWFDMRKPDLSWTHELEKWRGGNLAHVTN